MAREGRWWEDHLNHVLSTEPTEVMQEACHVLKKYGCHVHEELKSELYYSSTLCKVVFQVLHYPILMGGKQRELVICDRICEKGPFGAKIGF